MASKRTIQSFIEKLQAADAKTAGALGSLPLQCDVQRAVLDLLSAGWGPWVKIWQKTWGVSEFPDIESQCRRGANLLAVHQEVIRRYPQEFWGIMQNFVEELQFRVRSTKGIGMSSLKSCLGIAILTVLFNGPSKELLLLPLPQQYRGIQVVHLLKAGGTAAGALVHRVVNKCSKEIVNADQLEDDETLCMRKCSTWEQWQDMTFFRAESGLEENLPFFRIQMMREPCSYYLSVWAFNHDAWSKSHKAPKSCLPNTSKVPTQSEGKHVLLQGMSSKYFRMWLRDFHQLSDYIIGYLSYRSWSSQKTKEDQGKLWNSSELRSGPQGTCIQSLSHHQLMTLRRQMLDTKYDNVYDDVDCWVDQGNLYQDLSDCLQRFEAVHPGYIDWGLFKAKTGEKESYVQMLAKKNQKYGKKSQHQDCAKYFDDDLHELVHQLDKPIFDTFRYSCCQSSQQKKYPIIGKSLGVKKVGPKRF
eukprot:gnl/MRDRNA2_/MRDRNA2_26165_c0_seq1.p1 gnl/MRDRNA2_/MRDRNA2_26165_c0~~gnl/MRDRNA2_/MRDRNA2_26165_c0_seq1.p1  ORF type:complete len:471 (+),score=61.30 gnl/MRDRNA2_/MRDRNA2_26165_c0_seq1:275-1687(+)